MRLAGRLEAALEPRISAACSVSVGRPSHVPGRRRRPAFGRRALTASPKTSARIADRRQAEGHPGVTCQAP
jgi:hypothetical protein